MHFTVAHIPDNAGGYRIQQGNTFQNIVTAGSYSATVAVGNLINSNARGIIVHTNITQLPGSASTTWATKIKAVDPSVAGTWATGFSGSAITIAAAGARSASGMAALCLYPGVSETAGALTRINGVLPLNFGVVVSLSGGAANAGSSMFSVSIQLLL